jgi:squalene-hopene/tetraprenyl-beta-curcumene cyclase
MPKLFLPGALTFLMCAIAVLLGTAPPQAAEPSWNSRAAASYLDGRLDWWLTWPTAARDHDTACVSCHTAVPYALARPALRKTLSERELPASERRMLENVTKRVRLWQEVEPFYSDQTRGLPKTSESRGTEAIMNALILSNRDAYTGTLSDETKQAFANLWPLQFKAGDLKGTWAWLNFHNEPWEANGSPYFGASLAAMAIGSAPGDYANGAAIQDQVKALRDYLQKGVDNESLFNRLMGLWASAKLTSALTPAQRQSIVDAALANQQADGGWSTSTLASWKRQDNTQLDTKSDGFATGLVTLALQQAGTGRDNPNVSRGLAWLVAHQESSGRWWASSLNKERDPASDAGKFMSDAATAYAALSLSQSQMTRGTK